MSGAVREDEFSMNILLSHPSMQGTSISEALSMQGRTTTIETSAGTKATIWYKRLQEGRSEGDFESTLGAVFFFLQMNTGFFVEFSRGGGHSSFILDQRINLNEGKVLEVKFHPKFLAKLCECGISLVVEGWANGRMDAMNEEVK